MDDDLGVIAAYRHVLEGSEFSRASRVDELSDELYGSSGKLKAEYLDWRVHYVDQGEDAVAAIFDAAADSDPFTAVFLDIRMPPGIDGYATAQRIRQIDPNVHIVFVTAYCDYTEEELWDVAGPIDKTNFMTKPVWPDQLRETAVGLCNDTKF